MTSKRQPHIFATILGLFCGAVFSHGEQIQDAYSEPRSSSLTLLSENRILKDSLVESNKALYDARNELDQLRSHLEALGFNLEDDARQRLVQSVSDLQVLREQYDTLSKSSQVLYKAVEKYLTTANSDDHESRLFLEKAMRELDLNKSYSNKPDPKLRVGSTNQSNIISLDPKSGLLVLNVGTLNGVNIGMLFNLSRGQKIYGKAIVADVRNQVSGVLIDQLDKHHQPQIGDIASLIKQN